MLLLERNLSIIFSSRSFVGLAIILRSHWLWAATGNHHSMCEARQGLTLSLEDYALPPCPVMSQLLLPSIPSMMNGQEPYMLIKLNLNKLSSWMLCLIASPALSSHLVHKLLQGSGISAGQGPPWSILLRIKF